jgi:hypothetical protein
MLPIISRCRSIPPWKQIQTDDPAKPDKGYEPIAEHAKVHETLFGNYRDMYDALDKNGVYGRLAGLQKQHVRP